MGESKKGVSANQLKRMLGVSYKTAWYLCHRIRSAMHDENQELLVGIVEADETVVVKLTGITSYTNAGNTKNLSSHADVGPKLQCVQVA